MLNIQSVLIAVMAHNSEVKLKEFYLWCQITCLEF